MKILVISDLHVGTTARARDFCTEVSGASAITENFIEEFHDLVKCENITATHLLIAGDITNRAESYEFEIAAERINDIKNILKIDERNIFFVPGNHDGNWDQEKAASLRCSSKDKIILEKYNNIRNNDFFSSLLKNTKFSSYYSDPYSTIWEHEDLIVVGVNSSALDSYDKAVKFGEVDLKCLASLQSKLDELKVTGKRKFKILLTHHHPKNYTDTTFPAPDLSQMKNAEDFMRFAGKNEFDFIVHGHKHIPRYNFQMDSDGFFVNILSAGSFAAQLKDWHNGVANFFHLIEHHDFCPDNNFSRGKVISWSYFTNHKWTRSLYDRDRISHEEYYGYMVSRNQLKSKLRNIINQCKEHKNYAKWQDLIKIEPKLKYCNKQLLSHAVDDLSYELKYEVMPSKDDSFVLLWAED
ncbi:metallophosphoesterase family protein [Enterobacter roggenkampii]|uniref:metallophosphoesterase family protein n=1 Tax=Enterobacter roggenkampii TaxID=1812935 RepID=UPI001C9AE194|nr:metallophosphoesterase [Enterobacter roggenkampii]MBY7250047.1 metallophosphoesterase [Enterobacter roggenkampii]MCK7444218.1 metallophosphoesterase [Enterobacter roggenkampii]